MDPGTTKLFANPEDVREFMIARTTKAIDELVATAVAFAEQFGLAVTESLAAEKTTDNPAEVLLPDGTVAKLRI